MFALTSCFNLRFAYRIEKNDSFCAMGVDEMTLGSAIKDKDRLRRMGS